MVHRGTIFQILKLFSCVLGKNELAHLMYFTGIVLLSVHSITSDKAELFLSKKMS